MDKHTIAYFIGITILFVMTLHFIVTGKVVLDLPKNEENLVILLATLLVAYDYSYTHNFITF